MLVSLKHDVLLSVSFYSLEAGWTKHAMTSYLPEQWGEGGSEESYRIFCSHVNFPEMNEGISVYGGTKSSNHKERVGYH